jgi:hypothetical protein
MLPGYSIKKSIGKGVIFILQALAAVVLVTGIADIQIWDLIEQHIKPLITGLSVGGALAVLTNYVKYNWL